MNITGKSHIAYSVAKTYSLKVIDLRLAQCDPCDLLGFPTVIGNKSGYLPMETFPMEGDTIPGGYSGWLLFLDEFNSAAPAVQAAAYKLILDRMVGKYNLHDNVAIICAGNLVTDGAIVNEMSTALQSRLIHFELEVSTEEWCNWAIKNDISHYITDYIKFKPNNLYSFKPDHTDSTYAAPRTWEFANRILKDSSLTDTELLPLLSGTLSEGIAREFITFTKIYKELPTIISIQASPLTVEIPKEPSILFALTGSLAHNITTHNVENLMIYISRLPKEFQVVTLRETIRRKPEMLNNASIQKWVEESAIDLFS